MKNKLKIFLVLLIGLIVIPLNVKALEKQYNTLNFKETLAEENIEEKFSDYKPNNDAVTIYLFRGKGCGFCRAYLEFMNSIADEYGKYFKMESHEVWYDNDNSKLMEEVSTYLGETARGVPYIVIGDKVFTGYTESYNDDIKQAIMDLYNTKKNKRYDVFKEMKNHPKGASSDGNSEMSNSNIIIWTLLFTIISTLIIISFVNLKLKELKIEIQKLNEIKVSENKPKRTSNPKTEKAKTKK